MGRVIDRLNEYATLKGLNYNRITIECGLSVGLLNNANKGNGDISRTTIEKILSHYTDINKEWFLYGAGPMLGKDKDTQDEQIPLDLSAMVSHIESLERRIDELLKQNGELIAMLAKKG